MEIKHYCKINNKKRMQVPARILYDLNLIEDDFDFPELRIVFSTDISETIPLNKKYSLYLYQQDIFKNGYYEENMNFDKWNIDKDFVFISCYDDELEWATDRMGVWAKTDSSGLYNYLSKLSETIGDISKVKIPTTDELLEGDGKTFNHIYLLEKNDKIVGQLDTRENEGFYHCDVSKYVEVFHEKFQALNDVKLALKETDEALKVEPENNSYNKLKGLIKKAYNCQPALQDKQISIDGTGNILS